MVRIKNLTPQSARSTRRTTQLKENEKHDMTVISESETENDTLVTEPDKTKLKSVEKYVTLISSEDDEPAILVDDDDEDVIEAVTEEKVKEDEIKEKCIEKEVVVDSDDEDVIETVTEEKVKEDEIKDDENKDDEIKETHVEKDVVVDSDDEAPEDISLKAGRERAQEILKQQHEAQQTLKEQKKRKHKEWESKNQEQNKHKKQKKSVIPKKLDEGLLACLDKEIDIPSEKLLVPKGVNSRKIKIISKNDKKDTDNENNDVKEVNRPKISAQCLSSVSKNNATNSTYKANEFLRKHFFGRRIKRKSIEFR